MEKVSMQEKFYLFADYFKPRVARELNGQQVKFAGPFDWHHHDVEELVLIVPHGVEHRSVAEEEVHVLLFEPAASLNTGKVENDLTVETLESI